MPNKHVKTINGRRYYYESIRKGRKVTSKYLGPVEDRIRTKKKKIKEDETEPQDLLLPDDSYIG